MTKVISQETFDQVVKDNIDEFEMNIEEAIKDAVDQFVAQGVELSNIVKDLRLDDGGTLQHAVVVGVSSLKSALADAPRDAAAVRAVLATIREECDKSLAHRLLAAASGAYGGLLSLCKQCASHSTECDELSEALHVLGTLLNGQPDLLDDEGADFLVGVVCSDKYSANDKVVAGAARAIRYSCVLHEGNRQRFVEKELIGAAANALRSYRQHSVIVREVCSMLRSLTLDDDVRVAFGKGHDHAKAIVMEAGALELILDIAKDYSSDPAVLGELLSTVGQLAVRNEFCQRVMDLGGLELMLAALRDHMDSKVIAAQTIGVLKQVAGNDDVKASLVNADGAALIVAAVDRHHGSAALSENACAALAALTLRSPANSKRVVESNGPQAVLQCMKAHAKIANVQKQGCMAIRNMVARSREYCDIVLMLGAEELIRNAAERHKECADEGKAALRDLGCKVDLRELWKGERGSLAR